ncbi:HD-GYP domain-containing protein [Halomonas organivorans]|uniref:HD-GYP domain-containing protein (C-di-GMP phosphodiesterase class II) n=1 Tax=Halomonas organivorans TaxID=257772 RepID=A0A7W5BZR3_9GAMM|nr:HD-GYP domain-containing protein [Halomonas organivorans]MBB3141804.1 HD-GYP domain-containing protein (c-di-GMP phosphodiesterase class II) [Halomonas organivorans]
MQQDPEPPGGSRLVEVPVSLLENGMYIAALDRPWMVPPHLLKRGKSDLRRLRSYCRSVYVDPQRSQPQVQAILSALQMPPDPAEFTPFPPQERRRSAIASDDPREVQHAEQLYFKTQRTLLRLMRDEHDWYRRQPTLQREIGRLIASLEVVPDTLVWLTRLKHRVAYRMEHGLNVAILAMAFGQHLGYERSRLEELGLAGLLHDVGKMRLDQAVLDKPGPLSEEEFQHVQGHVLHGFAMLEHDPHLPTAVKIACRDYHERLDGSGYPHGKPGRDIDETARILAIVDTYDAITSDRVYSPARPATEALGILYQGRRCHFDGRLVDHFIDWIGLYPLGSLVELNNGMVGIVVAQVPDQPLRPRVLVKLDERKTAIPGVLIDLAEPDLGGLRLSVEKSLPPGAYGVQLEALPIPGG